MGGDPRLEVIDGEAHEVEVDEPSAAAKDRASKAKPGSSKRRGSPKGSTIPGKLRAKLVSEGGRITETPSPAECRRFVWALDDAIAGLLKSDYVVEQRDPRVEASGDALADISKWLPITRIIIHGGAPVILVGQQVQLMRDILDAAPQDGLLRRLVRRRVERTWQPEVVPGYEQAV